MYRRRSTRQSTRHAANRTIIYALMFVSMVFSTLIPIYFGSAALLGH